MIKYILLIFLFISNSYAKTIIISDLDETLRISKTHNYLLSLGEIIKGVKPFTSMQYIFRDFKQLEDVEFFYISASYYRFYNGQKWIKKHHFPYGKVYQKQKLTGSNGDFKSGILNKLWSQGKFSQDDYFIFLGDNSSHDERTYLNFRKKYQLTGEIFIRDIKSKATHLLSELAFEQKDGINYFFTEHQLLESPLINYLSTTTQSYIEKLFSQRKGIVKTQRVYIKRQLKKQLCKTPFYFLNIPCQVAVANKLRQAQQEYFK
jgi:phosphatidate phosphatase APP1